MFGLEDWRAPALAAAVWAGALCGTAGQSWVAGGAVAAGLGLTGLGWWRARWLAVAAGLALAVASGLGWARAVAATGDPIADLARKSVVVAAEARITGGQQVGHPPVGPSWVGQVTLQQVRLGGAQWRTGVPVTLIASGELAESWSRVPIGASVSALVGLDEVPPGDQASALARAREPPRVIADPGVLDAAVSRVRLGLRAAVAGLPQDLRGLVPALVLGDTEVMPTGLREQFRITGLTHLTAVSGANLTIFLAALLWMGARVGLLGWWRRILAGIGVFGFVGLCRAEPSVLRAAAMGLVGLAALGWSGGRQGLRHLSWAVVGLLLLDPWLGRTPGFVLSVLASAGIVLWARSWASVLSGSPPGRLPAALAQAVTVPLAAQLVTQPVVTAISGQVSLVGVVANLAAGPLVGPATVLGFAAAMIAVIVPPLAVIPGWLAGGFAQGLCWIAAAGSSLPGAALAWPITPFALIVLVAVAAGMVAVMPVLLRTPWLGGGLAAALVVALCWPISAPGWPPDGWLVVSCDVGQGDATVIRAGPGAAVVVDAGPEPRAVARCLDQLGVRTVPLLVFTHTHADHAGGLAGVTSGRQVGQVLFVGESAEARTVATPTPTQADWLAARPGMVLTAGQARVDVLSLQPIAGVVEPGEDSAQLNDSSMVVRVSSGGLSILIAGDVEQAGQEHAVRTASGLSAQVVLVPHHGSARGSPEFLERVGAQVALISVGERNDYGHPAGRTLSRLGQLGLPVWRTDQHGSIALGLVDGELRITTQKSS